MKRRLQRLMTLVRILSSVLCGALVVALLSGRTDRATERLIMLMALLVIILSLLWLWLRDLRDGQP